MPRIPARGLTRAALVSAARVAFPVLAHGLLATGCGDPAGTHTRTASEGGAGNTSVGGGSGSGNSSVGGASSGNTSIGGSSGSGNTSTGGGSGSENTGGSGNSGGSGVVLPPDPCVEAGTCPSGEWINVTPADFKPENTEGFGPGPAVVDPSHPNELYMGGGGDGVWKSVDYGSTWVQTNADIGYVPGGVPIAVAPTAPQATVYVAGFGQVHRSTDGAQTFEEFPTGLDKVLYSIVVDPYDSTHLISGVHHGNFMVESEDSGETWQKIEGGGFPSNANSCIVQFLDTGDAESTRLTWIAYSEEGSGADPVITQDGGSQWNVPQGAAGITHPHGNGQVFQSGSTLFLPGLGGSEGDGVYRSTDLGLSFERVFAAKLAVAWGSATRVYAMYGWACGGPAGGYCDVGPAFSAAELPGDTWSMPPVPDDLRNGHRHVAVTSDGTHNVFVGDAWGQGVWRYVEP
jgi:hypothetical protein